jgi:hypothetical protein
METNEKWNSCGDGAVKNPRGVARQPDGQPQEVYNHYYKPVPYTHVDVYRVLQLFGVIDPCLQHAVKKILVAGQRGGKNVADDVREAIATLKRWQAMRQEEQVYGNKEKNNTERQAETTGPEG